MSKAHLSRPMTAVALAVAVISGAVISGTAIAQAQTAKAPLDLAATHNFHIKAQPLADALKQFSTETNIKVVYADADVRGKTTVGLDGNYSGMESLTRLLTGTALAFKKTDTDVQIAPDAAASAPHGPVASASPVLQAAWKKFHATMDQMRAETENSQVFQTEPWNRAKGYHTLMEAQAMAYNFAIMPRLDYPRIQEATGWQLNNYTLGQDGPDSLYGNLLLDGRQTYKITGRVGDVRLTLLQVFNHIMGTANSKLTGNYDLSDFKVNKDGSFELILGGPKQEGNWIPLDPTSSDNWILVRRWIADWNNDPGEFHVEMTSKPADGFYDYDEFSEDALAKRIVSGAEVAKYMVESWTLGLHKMYLNANGGEENKMALLPGTVTSQVGSPSAHYALGLFNLKEDEALVVELDHPPTDAAYWSFQLADVWSRSLDFMNRQTSINMAEAAIGADGKFWAVISRKDPGIANWLDTADHQDGEICFRNYRSNASPVPVLHKVPIADIWKYLPPDTKRVTPQERAQHIEHRRQGLIKTYANTF